MQAGKRKVGLGLNAGSAQHFGARRRGIGHGRLEQRGLTNAWRPADHERAATPLPGGVDSLAKCSALVLAPNQRDWPWVRTPHSSTFAVKGRMMPPMGPTAIGALGACSCATHHRTPGPVASPLSL